MTKLKALFLVILLFLAVPSSVHADTSWNTVPINGTTGAPYTSIAMGSDGLPRIAYKNQTSSSIIFVRCLNNDCSSRNISTVDASAGNGGSHTALAIGSDGYGRIAYLDVGNLNLKFAQCTNDDCSTSVITTLDSTGFTGFFPSITMASDGFARIAYYDGTTAKLKYAQCNNAACSSTFLTLLPTTGNSGQYLSLALNSAGLPRISYWNSTIEFLMLALQVESQAPTSQGSGTPSYQAPSCTNSLPSGSPDLFQINATNNQATLYFAPTGNTTGYVISFGYTPGDNRFGASFNLNSSSGVVPYTINSLAPNTLYYFTVRAQNGCMPGSWSNSLGVKTTRGGSLVNKAFRSN